MSMLWPNLTFPPINLYSEPNMNYTEERRRSNALKLRPTKKPTKAQQPIIEPARGVAHNVMTERMMRCMYSHRGVRR